MAGLTAVVLSAPDSCERKAGRGTGELSSRGSLSLARLQVNCLVGDVHAQLVQVFTLSSPHTHSLTHSVLASLQGLRLSGRMPRGESAAVFVSFHRISLSSVRKLAGRFFFYPQFISTNQQQTTNIIYREHLLPQLGL